MARPAAALYLIRPHLKLGVMRTDGQNLYYKFLDTRRLPPDTARLIAENYWLPRKYFETPAD